MYMGITKYMKIAKDNLFEGGRGREDLELQKIIKKLVKKSMLLFLI